jgi:hypothetical protein
MTQRLWLRHEGQDVAEYALILAVVVLLVVVTVRLIGSSSTNIFSTGWKFNHAIVHDCNMGHWKSIARVCHMSLNVTTVFSVLPAPDEGAIYIMHASWAVMG